MRPRLSMLDTPQSALMTGGWNLNVENYLPICIA